MKKILVMAVALVLCMACLTSCDAMMQEIGKSASVAALDAMEQELQSVEFDTLERWDEAEIADAQEELLAEGIELKGELTGGLYGSYENPETDHWVEQLVLGVSAVEDAETLTQYFQEVFKTELEEGKAEIVNGGWIVSVTISSLVLSEAE